MTGTGHARNNDAFTRDDARRPNGSRAPRGEFSMSMLVVKNVS